MKTSRKRRDAGQMHMTNKSSKRGKWRNDKFIYSVLIVLWGSKQEWRARAPPLLYVHSSRVVRHAWVVFWYFFKYCPRSARTSTCTPRAGTFILPRAWRTILLFWYQTRTCTYAPGGRALLVWYHESTISTGRVTACLARPHHHFNSITASQ